MSTTKPNVPITFWIIAGIGLVWNLMGVGAFFSQVLMSEEAIAALPEAERSLRAQIPGYMNIPFGIAVFTGVIGCIVMLLRKDAASLALLISLITVIIHQGYGILMTDVLKVQGNNALIMPIFIILIAGFLYFYAMRCLAKGWLMQMD